MSRRSTRRRRRESQSRSLRIAGLVALVVVVAVGIGLAASGAGRYPADITVADAAARRDQGAFILDVRTPEEWEEYHIPDSTLIPLDELPDRVGEVPADREIVVVCRTGNRSQEGRDILRNAGLRRVASMTGGVSTWRAQGYPTVSGP
jgi:rhodanese-related sulfurtransferase